MEASGQQPSRMAWNAQFWPALLPQPTLTSSVCCRLRAMQSSKSARRKMRSKSATGSSKPSTPTRACMERRLCGQTLATKFWGANRNAKRLPQASSCSLWNIQQGMPFGQRPNHIFVLMGFLEIWDWRHGQTCLQTWRVMPGFGIDTCCWSLLSATQSEFFQPVMFLELCWFFLFFSRNVFFDNHRHWDNGYYWL